MAIGTILIRADASVAIGTGHVMRCLALAQYWCDAGGSVVFVVAELPPLLLSRLESEGFKVTSVDAVPGSKQDAVQTRQLAEMHKALWVVTDGYQFKTDYQREIKNAQLKLVLLDDNGEGEMYFADLVVNQNIHAKLDLYRIHEPYTRFLLGTRYSLLRREFAGWRDWKREFPPQGQLKLLITMGGSDSSNLSGRVLEVVSRLPGMISEITVVAGGSNPHSRSLQATASRCPTPVRLERDVYNMAKWMAWADVAISAAGSTCWEMCLLGLPAIITDVAQNQSALARELHRSGAVVHFAEGIDRCSERFGEEFQSIGKSIEKRRHMSETGRKLVDGNGGARVVAAMRRHQVNIRRALPEDCRMVWQWANDPELRGASFQPAFISWETHDTWFEQKLQDQGCVFLIGTDEDSLPIGQVRFDRLNQAEFEISISVVSEKRRMGFGAHLLKNAIEAFSGVSGFAKLHAFVKPENDGSIRLFQEAGFQQTDGRFANRPGALHFVSDFTRRLNQANFDGSASSELK